MASFINPFKNSCPNSDGEGLALMGQVMGRYMKNLQKLTLDLGR